MVEEVAAVAMPVSERIVIRKNRIASENAGKNAKRLSIVSGIHGDELDGQYICFELNRRISRHKELLDGIVDIYPAVNPLGMDTCTRGMPMFDLDMNRVFPGMENGATAEYLASRIVNDIIGSDMCVDLHSSNIFIKETPQVRVFDQFKDKLMPYAKLLNADFIWEYKITTVLEATLANSLNHMGVPTLVIEMGVGNRVERRYGDQIIDGIFNLMCELGMWKGEKTPVKRAMVSSQGHIEVIHARATGLFMAAMDGMMKQVSMGTHLGDIVDPLTGRLLQRIEAVCGGVIFTFREYPVVYEGAILCRIFEEGNIQENEEPLCENGRGVS